MDIGPLESLPLVTLNSEGKTHRRSMHEDYIHHVETQLVSLKKDKKNEENLLKF